MIQQAYDDSIDVSGVSVPPSDRQMVTCMLGIVMWHLSAFPHEMEVLSAPFSIFLAMMITYAGERLSVKMEFSKCLLNCQGAPHIYPSAFS